MPSDHTSLIENREPELARRRRWRVLKDSVATYGVGFGGISVIIAIVLIFFYLLYVVLPLFASASIEPVKIYPLPGGDDYTTEIIALEEQNEVGVRFTVGGHAIFFNASDGSVIQDITIAIPSGSTITSFTQGNPVTRLVAYGLSDGRVIIAKHQYQVSYPNDQRVITPKLQFPFGEEPLVIDDAKRSINKLELRETEEALSIVASLENAEVLIANFEKEESLLEEEVTLQRSVVTVDHGADFVEYMLLDKEQRNLYLADREGTIRHYDLSDKENAVLLSTTSIVEQGARISYLAFLAGELSLLVGDSKGRISQWFTSKDSL
ncbi:hypothetical protein [Kaarinaea lacus]